jgi:hypothetical protein
LAAVAAGLIAGYFASLFQLDPVSTILGGAVGGGVGGWIAKKQTDQQN